MSELPATFFRREYGRLVATLSRRVGVQHLETVEDAVQTALEAAVERWPRAGRPDDPSGWLFRVAWNRVLEDLRRTTRRAQLAARHVDDGRLEPDEPVVFLDGELRDDLLRMLFACCDDTLPVAAQLILALKVLCGFDVREIAERLFTSEANVYKRLGRARDQLRRVGFEPGTLASREVSARLPSVQLILHTLFTEGYLSSHPDGPIRRELCDEAIRLATELAEHPVGAVPSTFALLALLHLHAARSPARLDGAGGLQLLDEQDRSRWDADQIAVGLGWLARSAEGDEFTRYHAEAGIAAEHCRASRLSETRWDRVAEGYAALERLAPSPVHTLNRAVAVAEQNGPEAGLAVLDGVTPPPWLAGSHLWAAVFAFLHARAGHVDLADHHRALALAAAPSPAVRAALERRLRG